MNSKKYTITFKSITRQNKVSTKTTTVYGDNEEQAKANFEADAAEMLKHRNIKREFQSIEYLTENKTYSAAEDFANRYGVKPVQYEEE